MQRLLYFCFYIAAEIELLKKYIIMLIALFTNDVYIMSILFRMYKPRRMLEIGVGSGKTVELFFKESKKNGMQNVEYYGFDTFDDGPPQNETDVLVKRSACRGKDSEFWRMHNTSMDSVNAIGSIYEKLDYKIKLFKGNTRNTLPKHALSLPPMDMIYIDGGHSYETVKSDYENVKGLLKEDSILVFDDFICEEGVSKYIGELLSRDIDHYKQIVFIPGSVSAHGGVMVVLIYSEKKIEKI